MPPSTLLPPLDPITRFLHPQSPDPHTTKYTPHSRPIFSTPYGPILSLPDNLNLHEFCFPPDRALAADYDLFVNAVSGETVTLHQFYARVKALSRVFRWDRDGGDEMRFGKSPRGDWEDGEIIGRFSLTMLRIATRRTKRVDMVC